MAQSSDGVQYYPPNVWGLDFHFNTFNKMCIQDILSMEPYPNFTGAFCYNNHPIYKVDILGTVVEKTENSKCFLYGVDDGTGVILCCCWKENFYRPKVGKDSFSSLPKCLTDKLSDIERETDIAAEGYCLGDLVNMKGKIKIFREKKEIVVTLHFKVDNPMCQVTRMLELPRVYSLYYDRPFQPPKNVLKELTGQQADSIEKPEVVRAVVLKNLILDYFKNSSCNKSEYVLSEVMNLHCVKTFMSKERDKGLPEEKQTQLVLHALSILEDNGHVIKRGDRRMLFEVILQRSKFEQLVLKTLITETALPQYAEKGCHYLHILDELHKTLQYSKVKKDTVVNCLQKLEAQSDVIRSTNTHFLPCVV